MEKLWNTGLSPGKYPAANLPGIILEASFPEIAVGMKKNRFQWYNDYITTILQRDVRTLADIKNPDNIYQLLVSFAQRAAGLLNNAGVMKETGLDAKTYEKYKALCGGTFLVFELPPWSRPNKLNKRFVKQTKLFFTDTSLLCHIMQRDLNEVYRNDKTVMGHLFENFIAAEIMKAVKSSGAFTVSHFNPVQNQGREVDFIIENPNGQAMGIEVKLDGTINDKDCANMNALSDTLGNRFKKGIIIYTGTDLAQVSRNIWAVPVNYLWHKA
jgi:predicted AAA+ superfamily ATPase